MVHSESEQQWLARMQRHSGHKSGNGGQALLGNNSGSGMTKMANGNLRGSAGSTGSGKGTGRRRRSVMEPQATPEKDKTLSGEYIDDVSCAKTLGPIFDVFY